MTMVGNGVGVSVGGNQMMVGVITAVGVVVFATWVKSGVGEGVAMHAQLKKQMIKTKNIFFILIIMLWLYK
jgi:hypothetical protein